MLPTQLLAARLDSQGLLSPAPTLTTVLTKSVGTQAQVQRAAELNVFLRAPHLTLTDFNEVYAQQQVVRSWGQRWTWHLMTTADWNLVINARQAESLPKNYFQDNEPVVRAAAADIAAQLTPGTVLTKAPVLAAITDHHPQRVTAKNLLYPTLQVLAAHGHAFFDPRSKAQDPQLVAAGSRFVPMTPPDAIAQLIRHYLAGFSPATLQDFTKWAGMKISHVRPIWDKLAADLIPVQIGDATLFSLNEFSATDLDRLQDLIVGHAHLAARFDAMMTGYLDRTWLVPKAYQTAMWSKNGILMAPVIVNGHVVGKWIYQTTTSQLNVTIQHWAPIAAHYRREIEAKLALVATFLSVSLGDVHYLPL